MNSSFNISLSSSVFATNPNYASYSVISERTSDRQFQSVGAVANGSSTLPFEHYFGAYSVRRTTSFSAIHQEVQRSTSYSYSINPLSESAPPGPPGPGGSSGPGPAIGEDVSGSPIGDMMIPMLLIALGYVVVKLFRNRKTSQAL